MNDDAFTLTPLDIRKQEFRKTLRGYDTLGVEDFQMRVADALERVMRDRSVLEERVAALTAAGRTPGLGTVLVGDADAEILDAHGVVAAQALAELLLADVERREIEGVVVHGVASFSLGPNRTVPKRITVAPSATAVA